MRPPTNSSVHLCRSAWLSYTDTQCVHAHMAKFTHDAFWGVCFVCRL